MKNLNNQKIWRLPVAACVVLMWSISTACAEDASARGVVQAVTEATIAIDYTARIRKLPVQEGQSFQKGDVLIAFDCSRNNADVAAARAGVHSKELIVTKNRRLLSRGAIGSADVEQSVADLQTARAEMQAVQARTGSCNFKAPFAGRLVERVAQEHETPAPNQPLIKIVDTTNMEIETIVPSKWLLWLKPGSTFSFTVDETGQLHQGKVARLGAIVDPVSQTIKAYGILDKETNSVLPGMSGTATFHQAGS
jgi:membrane fusion protein, multidrug efflux system